MLWRGRGRSSQKYGQALFLVFLVLLVYQAVSKREAASGQNRTTTAGSIPKITNDLIEDQAKSWRALYAYILNNDPQCAAPEVLGIPHKLDTMYKPDHDEPRPDILWLKPQDVQKLKSTHAKFIDDIHSQPPAIPYRSSTQGIACTAGLRLLPTLTISLRMLRRTGCTLPVEVFLATQKDYDAEVCEHIFPSLNAKCLIFQDIVRAAGTGVVLTRFQYKIMALLFSSFESVLLLDSDTFPTSDPTYLFTSDVFAHHGMVLWPDFWYPSESPYYFEIADIHPIPPLNARPATESGEILVNKSKHNTTLLLTSYYNYYGPDFYYPLHSQGAPGQGDKETFGWAAVATHSPFYIVHTPVLAIGHTDSNGEFFGSAMAQHDPVADYAAHQSTTDAQEEDANFPPPIQAPQAATLTDPTPNTTIRPLFIHANYPKFDPGTFFLSTTQPEGRVGPAFDSNGTSVRPWAATLRGPPFTYVGYDLEAVYWDEIERVACDYNGGEGQDGQEEQKQAFQGAWGDIRQKGVDVCEVVRRWKGKVFGKEKGIVRNV